MAVRGMLPGPALINVGVFIGLAHTGKIEFPLLQLLYSYRYGYGYCEDSDGYSRNGSSVIPVKWPHDLLR